MEDNFLNSISNKLEEININKIRLATKIILGKKKNNKIILAGNGASATISSHVAVDFTKSVGILK